MPFDLDYESDPCKIELAGRYGTGKTGALASLVCLGYHLRILNRDPGIKTLKSLLGSPEYPYKEYLRKKNIDPTQTVSMIHLSQKMTLLGSDISPAGAVVWEKVVAALKNWNDGPHKLGSITSWGSKDVFVLDNLSRISDDAYYNVQELNGRLGVMPEGYDYQRDVGQAQNRIKSLMQLLFDIDVKCNVILISHLVAVDETHGSASRPNEKSNPDIYPSTIGRALSPKIPEFFPDFFLARKTGDGVMTRRDISTVPQDGVITKASAALKSSYTVETGLAEIFAKMKGQEPPFELMQALGRKSLLPSGSKSKGGGAEPLQPLPPLPELPPKPKA
jgi:hypothetical protein